MHSNLVTVTTVLFSSLLLSLTSQQQFLYIIPQDERGENSACSFTAHHCLEITELMENATLYLVSETTVLLLPGTHHIDFNIGNVLVKDIQNVAIRGLGWNNQGQRSQIHCAKSFGLTLVNVTSLTIENVDMVGCGSEFSPQIRNSINEFVWLCKRTSALQFSPCEQQFDVTASVITIVHSISVSIRNVSITNSRETALAVINTYVQLTLLGVSLVNNSINCVVATIYPFFPLEAIPALTVYQIINSYFISGNISHSGRKIATGLNVALRHISGHQIYVKLQNITAQNNHGWFGNVLLQVDKCPIRRNAKALIDITKLILKQSDPWHIHNNREGLSIETIIPVITTVRKDSNTEQNPWIIAKLKIRDIIIINSGVHIAIHTRYPSRSVDIELSDLSISHFNMGEYTFTIANADVTLTDFQLLSCSYIYLLNTKLTIQGTSLKCKITEVYCFG